jgi:glycogen debranching enzyme
MSLDPSAAIIPRSVARAIVIKDEEIFFLAEHDGGVPAGNQDGFGLYYHDCRYLNGYTLRIAGTRPNALGSTAQRGGMAKFELTNERLQLSPGHFIPEQTFGITLERVIDSAECAVHDRFTVHNYSLSKHQVPLSLQFNSDFEDVFEIRGIAKTARHKDPAEWKDGVLVLSYLGADNVHRQLEIHVDPKPDRVSAAGAASEDAHTGAEFRIEIAPGEKTEINLSLRIVENRVVENRIVDNKDQAPKTKTKHDVSDQHPVAVALDRRSEDWLNKYASVTSNSRLLNEVMRRSLLDLLVLRSSLHNLAFVCAGLPWYGALFGRDSIIAALETLAYEPEIAAQTIRLLAQYQGTKTDEWRDEQPGKILHELRRGELANLNKIPQTPYYGAVDSTPLFLILIGEHANWTGDLSLFNELRRNVERALHWIDHYGDEAHNGYLSYASKSSKGLGNQGWKDSGDSIMNADGSLATPPIALVEVQGYVYRAKLLMADLYARSRDRTTASRLRKEAEDLKKRFNHDFWVEEKQFYAIALQKESRPAAVISSNPGQALWTGIIDDARASAVVHRLTAEDMFSGWGVRTLSTREKRANPIGYHLGTVWPHDNSIIAAGFRRYGSDSEAVRVLEGIVQAASYFEHYRLPEVFAGFSRQQFANPMRYPVACHPQAWAAGSVPFLLTNLLGLQADAFNATLHVVRPVLPKEIDELEIRRIKVGKGSVDLQFRREAKGLHVEISNREGGVEVRVEPEAHLKAA